MYRKFLLILCVLFVTACNKQSNKSALSTAEDREEDRKEFELLTEESGDKFSCDYEFGIIALDKLEEILTMLNQELESCKKVKECAASKEFTKYVAFGINWIIEDYGTCPRFVEVPVERCKRNLFGFLGIIKIKCINIRKGTYILFFYSYGELYSWGKELEAAKGCKIISAKPFKWKSTAMLTRQEVRLKSYNYPYEDYRLTVSGLRIFYKNK